MHTNTIEGYFSVPKRGINGAYHHVSPRHLKRYLAEFDFRYNERAALGVSDEARADRLVRGIVGKRLTYRDLLTARRRWRVGIVPERIKITVRPSGSHPDVLTIEDAMRQVLDIFEMLEACRALNGN